MIEYTDSYDERSVLIIEKSVLPDDMFQVSIMTEHETATVLLPRADLLDLADEIVEELE